MLINFSLENWLSFRDKVTFSMVATRERRHKERIHDVSFGPNRTKILPISVIFGGNASGKTNFFKALSFAKKFVVQGAQPNNLIPVTPYLFDDQGLARPSFFALTILIDSKIYEFSFSVTQEKVWEEKLVLSLNSRDKELYHRRGQTIEFSEELKKDQSLGIYFKGTRDNLLFLTNSIFQQVEIFKPIYDWFDKTLLMIGPDSRFTLFDKFINENDPFYRIMNDMLSNLDCGIDHLSLADVAFDSLNAPPKALTSIKELVKEGQTYRFRLESTNERIVITRENGQLIAKKLMTSHLKEDGSEIKFNFSQETDGAQRIIDLLPIFIELFRYKSNIVCFIDDFDRSLHTVLLCKLIKGYLSDFNKDTLTQLIFTCHDITLIDQRIFRWDEIWVTERDYDGAAKLIPFSDYKDIRYDKDIRKSYLQGRFGGIPSILFPGSLVNRGGAAESEPG
ncbi:MAG: ATP-binding protein [Deltaproteobacteria bacterium]|jgi:AAA15 family ATPase/GTPase|nr:ATP-binding protein [Deltaproteobacteria bacterium]